MSEPSPLPPLSPERRVEMDAYFAALDKPTPPPPDPDPERRAALLQQYEQARQQYAVNARVRAWAAKQVPQWDQTVAHLVNAAVRGALRYYARFGDLFQREADRLGVPVERLLATAQWENPWQDPNKLGPAVGPSGARAVGLMQVMYVPHATTRPDRTPRERPLNLYNPAENIQAGAEFLAHLTQRVGRDPMLVHLGYMSGERLLDRALATMGPDRAYRWWHPTIQALAYVRARTEEKLAQVLRTPTSPARPQERP